MLLPSIPVSHRRAAKRISAQVVVRRVLDVPAPAAPPVPKNVLSIPAGATHVFVPFGAGLDEAAAPAKRRAGADERAAKKKEKKAKKSRE